MNNKPVVSQPLTDKEVIDSCSILYLCSLFTEHRNSNYWSTYARIFKFAEAEKMQECLPFLFGWGDGEECLVGLKLSDSLEDKFVNVFFVERGTDAATSFLPYQFHHLFIGDASIFPDELILDAYRCARNGQKLLHYEIPFKPF